MFTYLCNETTYCMEKNYPGEQWKPLVFDFEFVNETRIEVSNYGRVKTFNKISKGKILKGSLINGYKIIRLKFFNPRDEKVSRRFLKLQVEVAKSRNKVKELKAILLKTSPRDAGYKDLKKSLEEKTAFWQKEQQSLSKKFKQDLKDRTIHYHALFHRLVAEYFISRPSENHTVVGHLDYDKFNNRKSNLKWMTPEENYKHQRFSPNVIASKTYANGRRKETSGATKLSVTKVMLIKKLLNEGKLIRQLAKQFKVTETQISRIKNGVNWAEVPAAPSTK
ncbi:HNH endonuclease [soil metagenome]